MSKVVDLDTAVASVPAGARLGIGGTLLQRKPVAFVDALARRGTGGLRLHTFLGSLDVELLAAHGCLAEAHTSYVGFEQLGFAPAYGAAVDAGAVTAVEYTEYLYVAGLRAAVAGLPFQPTLGGLGSQVLDELGFRTVACPYTGREVVAVPATMLDVAVIHADAADEHGNVLGPRDRDFLWDLDATTARAADRVIVTVEELVPTAEVAAASGRTLLFGHEVAAVVHAPGGAAPTAVPGSYGADVAALRAYLAAAGADPAGTVAAARALTCGRGEAEVAR